MKVILQPAFKRDQSKIRNKELLKALLDKLEQIERAETTLHITGMKTLRGYATHCRIYVKTERHSYRIGAIVRGQTIWLSRFLSRKNIYQHFP